MYSIEISDMCLDTSTRRLWLFRFSALRCEEASISCYHYQSRPWYRVLFNTNLFHFSLSLSLQGDMGRSLLTSVEITFSAGATASLVILSSLVPMSSVTSSSVMREGYVYYGPYTCLPPEKPTNVWTLLGLRESVLIRKLNFRGDKILFYCQVQGVLFSEYPH